MAYKRWDLIGGIAVAVVGTLLHFVYGWTGRSPFAALFAPVNESTWEHLKLLFFPVLLLTVVQAFVQRQAGALAPARLLGTLAGMAVIVSLFYTYSGIVGRNFLAADILTFFIGVAAAFYVSRRLMGTAFPKSAAAVCWCAFLLLALIFMAFSWNPPKIALFVDPVTGGTGI